jgi:hypothetical protein
MVGVVPALSFVGAGRLPFSQVCLNAQRLSLLDASQHGQSYQDNPDRVWVLSGPETQCLLISWKRG